MPFNSDAEFTWKLLDSADDHVTREGHDIPAWFDMRLHREDWPTEIVCSVVVDEDQGPIINGIRGGRTYAHGYQDVARLFRESTDSVWMLRFMTAQAAGALATKRILAPHVHKIKGDEKDAEMIGKLRDRLASRAYPATETKRRRRVTRELLREVAEVYRRAHEEGRPPTQSVAEQFHVSHSSAGRWVVEARKVGILGPATGTKPGEASPST